MNSRLLPLAGQIHSWCLPRHLVLLGWNELRNFGWSPECEGLLAGELLAKTTKVYQKGVAEVEGSLRQYRWSDMYDPDHHALAPFYWASNGPFTGSWEGLLQSDQTVVLNWNSSSFTPEDPPEPCDDECEKILAKQKSLKHFGNLGVCQMIAGYCDDADLDHDEEWSSALDEGWSAHPEYCLHGYMYGTWRSGGYKITSFAKLQNTGLTMDVGLCLSKRHVRPNSQRGIYEMR